LPGALTTARDSGDCDGEEPRAAASTINVALEEIEGAAAIIDATGRILHANGAARSLADESGGVFASLVEAAESGSTRRGRWTVNRIHGRTEEPDYLVIARVSSRRPPVDVRVLGDRWGLTKRQREVLVMVVEGHPNDAIADALAISPRTVEVHVTAILGQAAVENRATLVATVLGLRRKNGTE